MSTSIATASTPRVKEMAVKDLRKTDGNRAAAARLLGLETKYFLRLMKSLQID